MKKAPWHHSSLGHGKTPTPLFSSLKFEDLIMRLGNGIHLLIPEVLCDLHHGRDHGLRSTEQDLDVGGRRGQVLLDHLCIDVSSSSRPVLSGPAQNIMHLELRVLLGNLIQLGPQQNVLLRDVCKEKADQGSVL